MAAWTVDPAETINKKSVAAVYETLWAEFCCHIWSRPEESQNMVYGIIYRPRVGQVGVFFFFTNLFKWEPVPMLWLSLTSCHTYCFLSPSYCLKGDLDYTDLEVMQLGLFSGSLCQLPSCPTPLPSFSSVAVHTALQGPAVWSGVHVALPLSVLVGRTIRTTPSSRLKAPVSPCQPAERLL